MTWLTRIVKWLQFSLADIHHFVQIRKEEYKRKYKKKERKRKFTFCLKQKAFNDPCLLRTIFWTLCSYLRWSNGSDSQYPLKTRHCSTTGMTPGQCFSGTSDRFYWAAPCKALSWRGGAHVLYLFWLQKGALGNLPPVVVIRDKFVVHQTVNAVCFNYGCFIKFIFLWVSSSFGRTIRQYDILHWKVAGLEEWRRG